MENACINWRSHHGCIKSVAGLYRGWQLPVWSCLPSAGSGDSALLRLIISREIAARIIYLHVPAAIWSMGIYASMAVAAFIGLVWQMKMANLAVAAMAPIGAVFTFIALVTGSAWGKPMWGTWWVWDARLTSELVLLFLYVGVIALWHAFDDRRLAGRAAGILVLIGVVNLPIIHYSVEWWNTLHQE